MSIRRPLTTTFVAGLALLTVLIPHAAADNELKGGILGGAAGAGIGGAVGGAKGAAIGGVIGLGVGALSANRLSDDDTSEPRAVTGSYESRSAAYRSHEDSGGRKLTAEIQHELFALGYDPGPPDGVPGPRTHDAIRSYQSRNGLPVDGRVSRKLLEHMRILRARQGPRQAAYQPGYTPQGSDCRSYSQRTEIDGESAIVRRGTACRQPDGTWQTQE